MQEYWTDVLSGWLDAGEECARTLTVRFGVLALLVAGLATVAGLFGMFWQGAAVAGVASLIAMIFLHVRLVRQRSTAIRNACEAQQAEHVFNLVLASIPEMIWFSSTDLMERQLYGDWRPLGIGESTWAPSREWIDAVVPDDREGVVRVLVDAQTAPDAFEHVFRARDARGEERFLRDRGAVVRDAQGQIRGFAGSCIDITDALRRRLLDAEEVNSLIDRNEALKDDLNEQLGALAALRQTARVSEERIAALDRERESHLQRLSESSVRVASLAEEVANLERERSGLRTEAAGLQSHVAISDATNHDLQQALGEVVDRHQRLRRLARAAVGHDWSAEEERDVFRRLLTRCVDFNESQPLRRAAFDVRRLAESAVDRATLLPDGGRDRCRLSITDEQIGVLYGSREHIEIAFVEMIKLALRLSGSDNVDIGVVQEKWGNDNQSVKKDPDRYRLVVSGFFAAPLCTSDEGGLSQPAGTSAMIEASEEVAVMREIAQDIGAELEFAFDRERSFSLSLLMPNLPPPARDERGRSQVRLSLDGVECNQGRVVDVSLGGVRIESSRVPRKAVLLTLDDGEDSITLRAKPVWSKRLAWRRFEIGLIFVDLIEDDEAILSRIAMTNRNRRTLGEGALDEAA